ncbi:MAG: DNA repair protein RecN [Mangrovicoccus sp.]
MLRGLDIRDILIIDRLELNFQPGLNVLTGETGAGKSILLDSLGFVLGWRGRADLVRSGAKQGEVTAWFDLPADHPARDVLAEAGLDAEDELVLRRVNSSDGRKTAYINDRRASGDVLRRLSAELVELHGQHDDRGLLNPKGHRALLDAYGDFGAVLDITRQAWTAQRVAQKARDAAAETLAKGQAEEDFLRHAVAELTKLDPQPGEEASLDTRRRMMQSAEKVLGDVRRAYDALGVEGAEGSLSLAARWLEGTEQVLASEIAAPLSALDRALTELSEAQAGVEACLEALEFDPYELESCEERLFALRAAARKHDVLPDDLADLAARLTDRLSQLDHGAENLAALDAELVQAQANYTTAAASLTEARQKAGQALDQAVMAELAPLKMDRAVFTTVIEATAPGPDGVDQVSFQVATNPGAPSGALDKIASGGELSRFLLALKVCLTQSRDELTLIFDEIDRGVGGATADAVGRRLANLAETGQVLVVTHSPQVAALGHHHWRVEKQIRDGVTFSTVLPLDLPQRRDEIARMISGDRITEEARAAANSLLQSPNS